MGKIFTSVFTYIKLILRARSLRSRQKSSNENFNQRMKWLFCGIVINFDHVSMDFKYIFNRIFNLLMPPRWSYSGGSFVYYVKLKHFKVTKIKGNCLKMLAFYFNDAKRQQTSVFTQEKALQSFPRKCFWLLFKVSRIEIKLNKTIFPLYCKQTIFSPSLFSYVSFFHFTLFSYENLELLKKQN